MTEVGSGHQPARRVGWRVGRRPRTRLALFVLAGLLAIVVGQYGVGRLRASSVALSIERTGQSSAVEFDGTLRVGCYNIAHARGPETGASNWDGGTTDERAARLVAIGRWIGEHELDVVVLNEVDFASVWSSHVDQASIIAEAAGLPVIVRQRNVDVTLPFTRWQFGTVILSRFPVRSAEIVCFEPYSAVERVLAGSHQSVIAEVELPGDLVIAVWAVHLESRDRDTRLDSAEKIIDIATDYPLPLIMAGDFNSSLSVVTVDAAPPMTALDAIQRSGLFQLLPEERQRGAGSFPTSAPERSIDWILVPPSWSIVSSGVGSAPYSDHMPVIATVHVAESPVPSPR